MISDRKGAQPDEWCRHGAKAFLVAVAILLPPTLLALSGCNSESQLDSIDEMRIDSERIAERMTADQSLEIGPAYLKALSEVDPFVRHMLLASVYGRIDASNFSEFREAFEGKLDARGANEARVFGNLWAKVDAQGAAREVMKWKSSRAHKFASEEIMSVLAQGAKGEVAIQALRDSSAELPDGVLKLGQESLAVALSRHQQLETLLELLQELEDTDHQKRLIALTAIEITRADRHGFARWVEQVKDDDSVAIELRYALAMQATQLEAGRNLEEGLAWYPKIAHEGYAGDALLIIVQIWGQDDPAAAMKFIRQRPESENPSSAKRAAAYLWLKQDPGTARVELGKAVNQDPTMSSAIFPLVQYMMVREIAEAMELAKQLPDLEERETVLKQGLVRWARLDPDGLDAYLAKNVISGSVRKYLNLGRSMNASRKKNPEIK